MKKIIKIIIAALLLAPSLAFATATSVDRLNGNHIEPLIKTDFIQAPYFYGTSTTQSSIFNKGIINRLFLGTDAFASGMLWNAALFGNSGENILVAGNTSSGGFITICTNNDRPFGDLSCSNGGGYNSQKTMIVSSNGTVIDTTYNAAPLINAVLSVIGTGSAYQFYVGTSTAYGSFIVGNDGATTMRNASSTLLSVANLTPGNCVQAGVLGTLTTTLSPCGSGGGSGASPFATTSPFTGRIVIYPNNATDVLVIGSNSTTTAEQWFDPNVGGGQAYFGGKVGVATTSPFARLSVDTGGLGVTPAFVVGSSTRPSFIVNADGRVAVGITNTTGAIFSVGSKLTVPSGTLLTKFGNTPATSMAMDANTGNVSIGTDVPDSSAVVKLYIETISSDPNPYGFYVQNTGSGGVGNQYRNSWLNDSERFQTFLGSECGQYKIGQANVADYLTINAKSTECQGSYSLTQGYVGINNNAPNRQLDVNGDIRTRGDYRSASDTAGFSGTCTILGLTSIVVENGIIVSCS